MTITLDLPDALATRLISLPEGARDQFAAIALADAFDFRETETEDFVTVVEQALADRYAGVGLVSFEDACRQWDAEEARSEDQVTGRQEL